MTKPRLVVFSGLGLDARFLLPLRSIRGATVQTPAWIEPLDHRESLASYAQRMADRIEPGEDLYLGGVSFGAMVALEAARRLRPRGVFVIAGARTSRSISPVLRALAPIAASLPLSVVRGALRALPTVLMRFAGRLDRQERAFMIDLFRQADPVHLRWAIGSVVGWECPRDLTCPIHQIHGEIDWIVPPSRVRETADRIVPNAGHVVHLTDAELVRDFIGSRM